MEMILNNFIAYIQFLAAFYISLGFEKLVDKIFFSDSYRRNVESLLVEIQKQLNIAEIKIAELNQLLNDRITDSYHWIRRLSFWAFLCCLLLLLLAGIELSFSKNDSALLKNGWLGNAWLVVILGVSLPLIYIGIWAFYRRFWKMWHLKRTLKSGSDKLYSNLSCCLSGEIQDCDRDFKNIVLQSVQNSRVFDEQLIEKALEEYARMVFEELKKKI